MESFVNMSYGVDKSKWNYQKAFFWILTISWVSGLTFFVFNNFITVPGEFGDTKHPFQYPILKIHGGSSFVIMVAFGYFMAAHVRKSWYARDPKPIMGIILLAMPIVSMITAYALYYIVSDVTRAVVIYIHLLVGFFLPFVLVIHIIQMTKEKKLNKLKRQERRAARIENAGSLQENFAS